MTQEELQAKYLHLVDLVRRMRGNQKYYFKYRTKESLERSKRNERDVDKLLEEEIKRQQSGQREIF